jgi:hypothetical protein
VKRHAKQMGIALLCVVLALVAAPRLIVRAFAVHVAVPGARIDDMPGEARALFWSRIGGEGEARLPDDSTLRLLRRVYGMAEATDPALRLAVTVISPEIPRDRDASLGFRRLRLAASVVWLSRNWSAAEALTAVLERARYGHRFDGLNAAALGYYDRDPAQLTLAELASLVVTANRTVKFNPWCRPEQNAEAVASLLADVELRRGESLDPLARLEPVPRGKCLRK